MISVEEAKKLIKEHALPKRVREVSLEKAFNKVLAEEVKALSQIPRFDNSAMDGYAVIANGEKKLKIIGEVQAGDFPKDKVEPGEAVRIMTGAMMPLGANAVVMREVTKEEDEIVLIEKDVLVGENIRTQGEEIQVGDVALKEGVVLNPAAIGFLASVGLQKVKVYAPPRVALLVTGNELVPTLEKIQPAQILESNSITLKAALAQDGIEVTHMEIVPDDKQALAEAIKRGLDLSDCLLVMGGVSVGNWDFTKEVLAEVGVRDVFWRVAQKPGKPLYFGEAPGKTIFGLPGNPASVLVCFYEYVRPHLQFAMGQNGPSPKKLQAQFKGNTKKRKHLTYFARAHLSFNNHQPEVTLIEGQESFRMGSFASANVLAVLPQGKTEINEGEKVEVHLLQ